jgi:hypothetical protein
MLLSTVPWRPRARISAQKSALAARHPSITSAAGAVP